MGWILGLTGDISAELLKKVKALHPEPRHLFYSDKIYLAAGGIPETCLSSISNKEPVGTSGWIVCGVGIKYENGLASLMDNRDWASELKEENFSQYHLNGHFAAIRWNREKIEIFTDQMGMRNIFITTLDNCIAFSSRLDWISKLNKNVRVNWAEFGSRWLLLNQLSDKSILTNVERMSQGGKAVINFDSVFFKITNKPWHPDLVQPGTSKDFISTLKDFTLCGFNNDKKISLALSGGLDSRILLAFFISSGYKNWSLHSFSFPDHPDTKIAAEISKHINREHFFWEPSIPSAAESVKLLQEYVAETMLVVPSSKFLNLRFYSPLYKQNKIVIDGAYGEIARRRLFVSLLMQGKKAIYDKNFKKIITIIRNNRPEFFAEDYLQIMENSLAGHVEDFCSGMPDAKEFGLDNWIDLFALRTRLLNSSSPEQSRSDKMLLNYMPFVQPSFLKKIFETPAKERDNNKFSYKIINDFYPALKQFPLAKDGVTYPFRLKIVQAAIWTKLKRKTGFVYKDTLVIQFLNSLSDYVQDIFNSNEVAACEYYDRKKVNDIINGFYKKKNPALAKEVDWLLSFETWRKSIQS